MYQQSDKVIMIVRQVLYVNKCTLQVSYIGIEYYISLHFTDLK